MTELFQTITAEHWRDAFKRSRTARNEIAEQIKHMTSPFRIQPASDFTPETVGAFDGVEFSAYQAAPGINKSGLDTIHDSPRRWHLEATGEINREKTTAMEWGSLVHEQILFGNVDVHIRPEVYGPDAKRWNANANECKAWIAAHTGKPVLSCDQLNQLRWEADCVLENKWAAELLTGGFPELSLFAREESYGMLMKARLDYFRQREDGSAYIVDIKTTLDASTAALSREIYQRRYHAQFAFYRRVLARLGVGEVKCYIIALEKGDLPRCQVREISQGALELGEAQIDADLDLYRRCKHNNWWPDFADEERDQTAIQVIDLPEYVTAKADNLIGMTEGE